MPKINVYLPDDLAEAVRATGLPVSAICQRALELSVRRLSAIRDLARGDAAAGDAAARLAQFTDRARTALALAVERAGDDGAPVGTEHLLHGVLAEGGNLAIQVLAAMEVEPARVARALADATPAPADPPADPASADGADDGAAAARFTPPAAAALEATVTEALALGHNYVGCEHLLLGLAAEPDGTAGRVLRELGADPRAVRQTVVAALTGYRHLRAQAGAAAGTGAADTAGLIGTVVRQELKPLLERVERLEQRAGLAAG